MMLGLGLIPEWFFSRFTFCSGRRP